MADLTNPSGATEIARHYTYDRRRWLKSFWDERVTTPAPGSCPGGMLADEDAGACMPPHQSGEPLGGYTYTYDAVGNRTDNAAVLDGNQMKGLDGYTLTYDDDGNLTQKVKPGSDDMRPVWNSLGQMISAWRYQRGTAHYGYDAFGRRARRTAPDGTVIRYLYDGDDLLAELDGATGQTIREYTYYPGVDRPHSVRAAHSGASYYYATDHPGNVVGLINGAKQLENEYRYIHFGEVEVAGENIPQPLRFAAREWDSMPRLYQVRARWYDPQSGRFVSEDPIRLAGGINPYVYANNSPTNLTDPYGLCPTQPPAFRESAHQENEKTLDCYMLEGVTGYARRRANWLFGIARGDGFSAMFGRRGSPVAPSGQGEPDGTGALASAATTQRGSVSVRVAQCISAASAGALANAKSGAVGGAVIGTAYGGFVGGRIGAGLGGSAGAVVGTSVGAPTFIAAPLAGMLGASIGTVGGA
jgi:RHS repeat-associated protein